MNLAALGMNENLEENKNEKPFVGPKSPEASAEVDILAVDDKALHKSIQQLVTDGRLDEAECEVKAALEKSPDSESVLVLGSLVAMSEQRWDDAASRLITLLKVQGENAPAMTHLMMIRTLRCQDKHLEAMEAAMFAVKTHYDDMEIVEEAASVAEYLNEW